MNYTTEQITSSHYGYVPNMPANMFALVIFIVLLLIQAGQGIYFKQWWFAVTWFLGLILQVVGYGTRVGSIYSLDNFVYYCVQTSFLTISPAFLMAGIYYQLAKVVAVHGQKFSYLRPKAYTRLFISCDIVSILVQAGGGGVASAGTGGKSAQIGQDLMITGLVTQVVSMIVFLALFCTVVHKIRKSSPTNFDPEWSGIRQRPLFHWFIPALLTSTILILIRSIYRVVELSEGWGSTIARTERWQLIFDGLFVLLACMILTVVHPGACLGPKHIPIDGTRGKINSDFLDDDSVSLYNVETSNKGFSNSRRLSGWS